MIFAFDMVSSLIIKQDAKAAWINTVFTFFPKMMPPIRPHLCESLKLIQSAHIIHHHLPIVGNQYRAV